MSVKRSILFVSHAASRNGATILLLNLVRWLREHTDDRLEVLMIGGGELVPEFRGICKTVVWRDPGAVLEGLPRRWKGSWKERLGREYLRWCMAGRRYDLVYFNTSALSEFVPVLAGHAERVLWHIHELQYTLRLATGEERMKALSPLVTRFITVSESVSQTLAHEFQVPPEKLDLVHGFVPLPNVTEPEVRSLRQRIRRQLDWPDDAFVVGGCGALGWRKGTDVFLQVAQAMLSSTGQGRTRFLWVGGGSADEALRFEHDIRSFGLGQLCKNVPTTAAVMDYYHAMDIFALTSREDPFPLVMLEAAACNLPIVCFDRSGGGPEFVAQDAGLIAPYLDVPIFASCLDRFRESPELRRKCGSAAAQKVRTHHTLETQGPKVLESINHCLAGVR
jgi:glycosyltransferase involved in cell wall biosynthesis